MPPLALRLNELRLPTDADQYHSASSFERGDDRFGLEGWNIQSCSAGDTMQFHVHHVVRADLWFPGTHSHPLVVCSTPCARSRASLSESSCSRLLLPAPGVRRANLAESVLCAIADVSLAQPAMPISPASADYNASSVSVSILVASCSPTSCLSVS